jgi:hypothetical protein
MKKVCILILLTYAQAYVFTTVAAVVKRHWPKREINIPTFGRE